MASSERQKTTHPVMEPSNEKTLAQSGAHESDIESEDVDFRSEAEAEVLETYKRLADGEIRILVLYPGKTGEDIHCDLFTSNFEAKPRYEAISYAWGLSHNLLPMVLNGKRCLRRHNLLACLENLRYENESRALWVDALCINQSDVEERNAQIKLMPQVYQSAFKTLIWLGEDGKFTYGWVTRSLDTPPPSADFSESLQFLAEFANDQHIFYHERTATMLHGLELVCELDWWSRMWVVQETLLSPFAYIVLGKYMLSWDTICQSASSLLRHVNTCCRQPEPYLDNREYERRIKQHVDNCVQIIQSFQRIPYETNNDLLAHLWTFRNRLASVKHDKVYGILGLLHRQDSLLEPDYEENFSALCRSVMLKDIQLSNNLNALQGIRESDSPDVTSWSIDWSYLDYWSQDRLRVLSSIYKQVYHASLDQKPRVAEYDIKVSGYRALRVAGRVVDHVVYATDLLDFDTGVMGNEIYKHVLEALRAVIALQSKLGDKSYVAGGSYVNAFWRTLLADCMIPSSSSHELEHLSQDSDSDQHHYPNRRATPADFFAFMLWMLSASGGHFTTHEMALHPNGILTSRPTRQYSTDETLSYQHAAERIQRVEAVQKIGVSVVRATSARRMFVTEKGYLGLGPHSLAPGDAIAILLGGCTPFVLERGDVEGAEEEHWKLLGDCYVHGWMDGELVGLESTEAWGDVVFV